MSMDQPRPGAGSSFMCSNTWQNYSLIQQAHLKAVVQRPSELEKKVHTTEGHFSSSSGRVEMEHHFLWAEGACRVSCREAFLFQGLPQGSLWQDQEFDTNWIPFIRCQGKESSIHSMYPLPNAHLFLSPSCTWIPGISLCILSTLMWLDKVSWALRRLVSCSKWSEFRWSLYNPFKLLPRPKVLEMELKTKTKTEMFLIHVQLCKLSCACFCAKS